MPATDLEVKEDPSLLVFKPNKNAESACVAIVAWQFFRHAPTRSAGQTAALRLLMTMRLTPEKMGLIVAFVESYLELTTKEMVAFEREMDNILDVKEKRNVMELITSWERKGRQEGRAEGELIVIKRLLNRRIGTLDAAMEKKLGRLSLQRLEALAEALLDFTGPQDLDRWLANGKN